MLKSVRVPPAFEPPFARAEQLVEKLFGDFQRRPEEGTLHISGDRYILVRAESMYASWFDALAESFGEEVARDFIYNSAREIGRSDSKTFSARLGLTDGVIRSGAFCARRLGPGRYSRRQRAGHGCLVLSALLSPQYF
jgi:hypothetical protein